MTRYQVARLLTAVGLVLTTSCGRRSRATIGLGFTGQLPAARVAELDAAVGADRRAPLGIVFGDGPGVRLGVPASEVDRAARLANVPGIVGVVGAGGSREALMVAPIYNEARVPQIVPTGTSRLLRTAGPWTLTFAPDDSTEGEFIGRFAAEQLRARATILFYVLDEYGTGLRDGVMAALARRGVRVLDAVPVSPGGVCPPVGAGNTYASVADAALRRGRPDVIVLATRERETGCIVAHLRRRRGGLRFVAGDGLTPGRYLRERAGSGAEGIYIAAFWHPARSDSLSRAFVRRYTTLFGVPPRDDEAMVYDAMRALAAAVRGVGPDRGRIRAYLRSLGRERPPLPGVTGPITFPRSGAALVMTRVSRDGTDLVAQP